MPMNKVTLWLVAIFFVGAIAIAEAQQPAKVFRIGYLGAGGSGPPAKHSCKALRDLGYVEGKNITVEYRTPGEKSVGGPPIWPPSSCGLKLMSSSAEGAGAIRAAKNASATIPIVMAHVNDPIVLGLVASLAHPGGNITGNSNLSPELSGKRVGTAQRRFYRECLGLPFLLTERKPCARALKRRKSRRSRYTCRLQLLEVNGPDEIESAFDAAKKQRADALVQIEAALFAPHQQRIIDLATKARLPAVHNNRADVETGGLMSYGPDRVDMNRRAAPLRG